jgi:hypothetical protein
MRRWILLALVAIVALATTAAGTVQATAAGRPTPQGGARSSVLRKELARLSVAGASDAEIRRLTGLRRVSSSASTRAPFSDNSAVSVSTPAVYYDNQAHTYYVIAKWNFSKVPPDSGCCIGIGPVGGPDGFGLSFSHQINNGGGSLDVCPKFKTAVVESKCVFATNYADNSATGVAWKFQDGVVNVSSLGKIYTAGTGSAVFDFKPLSNACLQVFSKYGHTWSSTGLSSIAVGLYSIGFGWTSAGHDWTRSSGAGKLHC